MKSFAKMVAFVAALTLTVLLIHGITWFVFKRGSGLLLHHGVGHVTFYVLFVLNVFLFQKYVNRKSFLSLGLQPSQARFTILGKGWLLGVTAFVVYTLVMVKVGIFGFRSTIHASRVALAFFVAFSGFTIALFEEILFRGFFLQTCLEDMPKWLAVVITSFIFCIFHDLSSPWSFFVEFKQAMLFGGLFSLSVLLCYAYLKTGNLYLPIGIHSGLVFGKVFFRKAGLLEYINNESWIWGLQGDARRGLVAWVLFLLSMLAVYWIVKKSKPT